CFPDFCRISPRSAAGPVGGSVPSSSENSRRAAASASSPGAYSPLGIDHAPASWRAQNGPPGWTSSTSTAFPRPRCKRIPALLAATREAYCPSAQRSASTPPTRAASEQRHLVVLVDDLRPPVVARPLPGHDEARRPVHVGGHGQLAVRLEL